MRGGGGGCAIALIGIILLWIGIILLLICVGMFAAVRICARRRYPVRKCDCLLVLGARIHPDGSLCRTLRWRCERALRAWQEGIAPVLIACGGQCPKDPGAEARFMRAYFLEHGVPEACVLCEDRSLSTYANIAFASEIMAEKGMRSAAIVTSDYHLTRALWIAKDQKMDVCGIPAASSKEAARVWKNGFRETLSWMKYFRQKFK